MPDSHFVFVAQGGSYIKLELESIVYLEADGSYCSVYTSSKTYQVSANIKKLHANLNSNLFYRISRKHVVNIKFVEHINSATITVAGKKFPISRVHKKNLLSKFYIMNPRNNGDHPLEEEE